MITPIRLAGGLLTVALGTVMLGGCSGSTTTADELVDNTMDTVADEIPLDGTLLVQDKSPVVDLNSTYNADQFGSDKWRIIAACSSAETLVKSDVVELAVIPTDSASEAEVIRMRESGDFDDAMTCDF